MEYFSFIDTLNLLEMLYYLAGTISLFVIVYQFRTKNRRDTQRNTIIDFNKIHKLTFELKDEIAEDLKKINYNINDIADNPILEKKVMDYLTIIEGFALSVQNKTSDINVFDKLASKKFLQQLQFYLPFIETERQKLEYNNLFDCYKKMVNKIEKLKKFGK